MPVFSKDGGVTWSSIYACCEWERGFSLDEAHCSAGSQLRCSNLKCTSTSPSNSSVVYPGWYVDDIGIRVTSMFLVQRSVRKISKPSNGEFTHSGTPDDWQWGYTNNNYLPNGLGLRHSLLGSPIWRVTTQTPTRLCFSPVIDLSGVVLPPGFCLVPYVEPGLPYRECYLRPWLCGGQHQCWVPGKPCGNILGSSRLW